MGIVPARMHCLLIKQKVYTSCRHIRFTYRECFCWFNTSFTHAILRLITTTMCCSNDQNGFESAHQKYIAFVLMILFKGFEELYIGISCFSPAFCLIHKVQMSFKTRSYAFKVNLQKFYTIYFIIM